MNDLSFAGASDFVGAGSEPVLSVRDLTVEFKADDGVVHAAENYSRFVRSQLGLSGGKAAQFKLPDILHRKRVLPFVGGGLIPKHLDVF